MDAIIIATGYIILTTLIVTILYLLTPDEDDTEDKT